MKRTALLLLIFAALAGGTSPAEILRVRLWSQHPPRALQLSAAPNLELRTCPSCAALDGSDYKIVAHGDGFEVGQTHYKQLLGRGKYLITVDGRAVQLSAPLEISARDGVLLLTIQLPLEEYVAGVLAGEAEGMRSPEALKAMAVAARTFAVHFHGRHAAQGFDFCDSTHCQDLRLSAGGERARAAAEATQGELLWYQGTTAATYYHKDCGGTTERSGEELSSKGSALIYLPQQTDPWCQRKGGSGWQATLRKADVGEALWANGIRAPRPIQRLTVATRSSSGRVLKLRLEGASDVMIGEDDFYTAIGRSFGWSHLRSALYEVEDNGDSLTFRGRGDGHGAGLCQSGAEVMGEEGHSYSEILAFYYPHTQLGVTAQGLRWTKVGSERFDLLTTQPEIDRSVFDIAIRALREAEDRSGLVLERHVTLRVYPTVAAFRDGTGEPGWVASSTRGDSIRLQPVEVLKRNRSFDSVLRHEFLHMLVESKARPTTPLWLREGLVLWLNQDRGHVISAGLSIGTIERELDSPASERELREGYAAAEARVATYVHRYGQLAVIRWLSTGVPAELTAR
jgi:stage II sporulation protein D